MIKAIVTDIEGTTTSVDFVYQVLFPYARAKLGDFVRNHAEDADVVSYINAIRSQVNEGSELDLNGVIEYLEQWMAEDKKITALKGLQGLVWEAGYLNGDFQGHVYVDAYENLRLWHQQGIALYIYSSGSVKAQQLLFGYTQYGDLNPWFKGYFDTTIGAKVEVTAYQKIIKQLGLAAADILFLSDVVAELAAAQQSGMQTCWVVRDDNNAKSHEDKQLEQLSYRQVKDFNEINRAWFNKVG